VKQRAAARRFIPIFAAPVHDGDRLPRLTVGEELMAVSSLLAEPSREQTLSVIDEEHLGRMTLGDRSLEREVLEIFARQTTLTLRRLAGAEPARAAAAAHTLKGSARGIGAWRVAQAAERLEQAAHGSNAGAIIAAVAELETAGAEVREAIGMRLGGNLEAAGAVAAAPRSREH